VQVGAPDRAQRVAAGLDQGAERVIDGVGQRPQSTHRHGELLGERARPAGADADLGAERAHPLVPGPAPPARAAAQHGVARHAAAEPVWGHALADRRHGARPLVTDAHRVLGESLAQVLHLAREELDVGAAHPRARDVDDHLARRGGGRLDIVHRRLTGTGDDEGSHCGWPDHQGRGSPRTPASTVNSRPASGNRARAASSNTSR
jgi:hypothetical protein